MEKQFIFHSILLFLIAGRAQAVQTEVNLIEKVSINKNKLVVVANKEFSKTYLSEDFYVEYDADVNLEALDPSLVIMPFFTQVISIVWASGKTYYIDSMDRNFYESLKKLKKVFEVLYPRTSWNGELIPRKLVDNVMTLQKDPATHVALLYSGGLDSTTTSFYLADKKQLLITAWGQWDLPIKDERLWNDRKAKTKKYAASKGYECAFLKSNYVHFLRLEVLRKVSPEIHHWRAEAVEGIGWAGLTAPILFTKGYCSLYIASSESWNSEYPSLTTPYIDNNITVSSIRLFHHLFAFSRIDKIVWLVQELKRRNLPPIDIRGCRVRDESNCCKCTRCSQTMAGLILMGENIKEYGYDISLERAAKHIKKNVTDKSPRYEDMYLYTCLAELACKRIADGYALSAHMSWLPGMEFDYGRTHDTNYQQKIDFGRLHELFPQIRAESDADLANR